MSSFAAKEGYYFRTIWKRFRDTTEYRFVFTDYHMSKRLLRENSKRAVAAQFEREEIFLFKNKKTIVSLS